MSDEKQVPGGTPEGGEEPRRGGAPPSGGRAGGGSPSRRRYSASRKASLIEAYRTSGQTMSVFCTRQGLSTASLCKWLRRYEAEGMAGLSPRRNPRNRSGRHRAAFRPAERVEAVEAYRRSGLSQAVFCARWGISVSSLRKWSQRYDEGGAKALGGGVWAPEPSKAAEDTPSSSTTTPRKGAPGDRRRVPESVREAIVATKTSEPSWGMRKIRDWLARFGGVKVSASSVGRVLSDAGIEPTPTPKRRRRSADRIRRFERARPGQLWQSDITSYVLPRSGRRVYLTVFLDDCSRYIVGWNLASHQKSTLVIEALRDALTRFGKPEEILTDQGPQYHSWRGKSAFHKLLMKEGIGHVLSRSHHPQTLGKCERLWKTIGVELWDRVSPRDVQEARGRMGHWIAHYNHFRPHQGIDGLVPADRFFESETELRPELETSLGDDPHGVALADPSRSRVYLFGRIGEQSVSLHGEQGRLVVSTNEGPGTELDLEQLGMPSPSHTPPSPDSQPLTTNSHPLSQETHDDARNPRNRSDLAADADVRRAEASRQETPLQEGAADAGVGAGAVGVGGRGGAGAGSPPVCDDLGDVAGSDESSGGSRGTRDHAGASVAALTTRAGRDAGGAGDAAENAWESDDGRPGGRPEGAAQAHRGPGVGTPCGDGSDHAAARAADASRGGHCGGEEGEKRVADEGEEEETRGAPQGDEDELAASRGRGKKGGDGRADTRWRRGWKWAAGWLKGESGTEGDRDSRGDSA